MQPRPQSYRGRTSQRHLERRCQSHGSRPDRGRPGLSSGWHPGTFLNFALLTAGLITFGEVLPLDNLAIPKAHCDKHEYLTRLVVQDRVSARSPLSRCVDKQ